MLALLLMAAVPVATWQKASTPPRVVLLPEIGGLAQPSQLEMNFSFECVNSAYAINVKNDGGSVTITESRGYRQDKMISGDPTLRGSLQRFGNLDHVSVTCVGSSYRLDLVGYASPKRSYTTIRIYVGRESPLQLEYR